MIRSRCPDVPSFGKDHRDLPFYLPKLPCVGHAFVFVTYRGQLLFNTRRRAQKVLENEYSTVSCIATGTAVWLQFMVCLRGLAWS